MQDRSVERLPVAGSLQQKRIKAGKHRNLGDGYTVRQVNHFRYDIYWRGKLEFPDVSGNELKAKIKEHKARLERSGSDFR